ncbi:MAG: succinyl-diaminopimelate desuccinylase [Cellvibrionaceae bacterium]|jgi:succinyl-diaminopimelate desuccinylase
MQIIDKSPTVALACELIERPSVTPDDAGCQKLIRHRLEALGFDCKTLTFGEGTDAVENLWAIRGEGGPVFCFAGHTDVVPVGNEQDWHLPPFQPTIENRMLYGRGAADMKGSLAAMLTATEAFVAENPSHRGHIAYLITADEEGPADNGTVKVVDWLQQQGIQLDWCLVGEPSSTSRVGDIIKNGRRGSLGGKLRVCGKQGHVAYPHLAENPIHKAAPALAALARETWDEGNEFFPPTTFQISNIHGGTGATNVIPGTVDITFNFRFSTALTVAEIQSRTKAILDKCGINCQLSWQVSGEPFLTERGVLIDATVMAIEANTGYQASLSTAGGTSDGRFIAPTGAQIVELGPVNATIHQVNECVNIDDLDTLSNIYRNILSRLLT